MDLEEKGWGEEEWEEAVLAAAKRADAVSAYQVVEVLRHTRVPKDQLDALCSQLKSEYPSLFWTKTNHES